MRDPLGKHPHGFAQPCSRPLLCPLVHDPQEGCHCRGISSTQVIDVVRYCMKAYELCPIYRRKGPRGGC